MRGEAVADESQPLQNVTRITEEKHNARCGLSGKHENQTSISAKGNLHCPLYSEKEGLCGLKPI